jgi:hypothetical protein
MQSSSNQKPQQPTIQVPRRFNRPVGQNFISVPSNLMAKRGSSIYGNNLVSKPNAISKSNAGKEFRSKLI